MHPVCLYSDCRYAECRGSKFAYSTVLTLREHKLLLEKK